MPDISQAANQLAADSDALADAADLVPVVVPGVEGEDKGRAHTLIEFAKRILARLTTADLGSGTRDETTVLHGDGVFRGVEVAPSAFSTTTQSWNVADKPNALLILSSNRTLSVSGAVDGGVYTLLVRQGAGGATLSFPGPWKFRGGVEETVASGARAETLITIRRVRGDIYVAPFMKDLA